MPNSITTPVLEPRIRRHARLEGGERMELSGQWILRAFEAQMTELAGQQIRKK